MKVYIIVGAREMHTLALYLLLVFTNTNDGENGRGTDHTKSCFYTCCS